MWTGEKRKQQVTALPPIHGPASPVPSSTTPALTARSQVLSQQQHPPAFAQGQYEATAGRMEASLRAVLEENVRLQRELKALGVQRLKDHEELSRQLTQVKEEQRRYRQSLSVVEQGAISTKGQSAMQASQSQVVLHQARALEARLTGTQQDMMLRYNEMSAQLERIVGDITVLTRDVNSCKRTQEEQSASAESLVMQTRHGIQGQLNDYAKSQGVSSERLLAISAKQTATDEMLGHFQQQVLGFMRKMSNDVTEIRTDVAKAREDAVNLEQRIENIESSFRAHEEGLLAKLTAVDEAVHSVQSAWSVAIADVISQIETLQQQHTTVQNTTSKTIAALEEGTRGQVSSLKTSMEQLVQDEKVQIMTHINGEKQRRRVFEQDFATSMTSKHTALEASLTSQVDAVEAMVKRSRGQVAALLKQIEDAMSVSDLESRQLSKDLEKVLKAEILIRKKHQEEIDTRFSELTLGASQFRKQMDAHMATVSHDVSDEIKQVKHDVKAMVSSKLSDHDRRLADMNVRVDSISGRMESSVAAVQSHEKSIAAMAPKVGKLAMDVKSIQAHTLEDLTAQITHMRHQVEDMKAALANKADKAWHNALKKNIEQEHSTSQQSLQLLEGRLSAVQRHLESHKTSTSASFDTLKSSTKSELGSALEVVKRLRDSVNTLERNQGKLMMSSENADGENSLAEDAYKGPRSRRGSNPVNYPHRPVPDHRYHTDESESESHGHTDHSSSPDRARGNATVEEDEEEEAGDTGEGRPYSGSASEGASKRSSETFLTQPRRESATPPHRTITIPCVTVSDDNGHASDTVGHGSDGYDEYHISPDMLEEGSDAESRGDGEQQQHDRDHDSDHEGRSSHVEGDAYSDGDESDTASVDSHGRDENDVDLAQNGPILSREAPLHHDSIERGTHDGDGDGSRRGSDSEGDGSDFSEEQFDRLPTTDSERERERQMKRAKEVHDQARRRSHRNTLSSLPAIAEDDREGRQSTPSSSQTSTSTTKDAAEEQ